jgi:muramoyltetrapeptide carboxypeptidase
VDYAVGTDMMPNLRGAILFLEEVNEPPYKLDGMLRQLILAGSLRGIRGVALGDFLRCKPRPGRRELPAGQVLTDHLKPLGVPCLGGIPAGHGRRNLPLPLGALALLNGRAGRLVYEQGLVS